MLSQLVVLFTFLVIQSMSEQFKCEVIPFETNDARGTCCIHLKNKFGRPSREEIDRQILEEVIERRNQGISDSDQRDFGKNGQTRNGEFGIIPKTYTTVTENVNGFESTSRRVPFIKHIDRNRVTERNPIIFEETNYRNSGRRDHNEYNDGSVDTVFNSKADDNLNTNMRSKIRPLPGDVRNENPKSSTVTEKTFFQVEKSYNQKKVDRHISQGKNESYYNSINRTKGDNEHGKPAQSNNTIPDLGNRNNVNVPDTCTEGYATNANGKCVKIFQ